MLENLNESKGIDFELSNKKSQSTFSKNVNKGAAPKPTDIQKMFDNIIKKEGK